MDETYKMPKDGWVCFHCGEKFITWGSAQDHFGAEPGTLTGCQIKAGDECGLLMKLRKAEKRALAAEERENVLVEAVNQAGFQVMLTDDGKTFIRPYRPTSGIPAGETAPTRST